MDSAHTAINKNDIQELAFDAVIVFGEGPIKPILLEQHLTRNQQKAHANFINDPLRYPEPDFWLMQQPRYLSRLRKIDENMELSAQEKRKLKEKEIQNWQQTGWFGLRRMGRQNALAAGCALYKGLTREVIISGGRTMSAWARKHLSKRRRDNWPAEATLMAEIIKTYYGALYEKKYGHKIDDVIKIEDASTNTLENFVYTLNAYPQLLSQNVRVGFLSAGHHMKRLQILAQIFGLKPGQESNLSAQELLKDANGIAVSEESANSTIVDEHNCSDTKEQYIREERWIRGLSDPRYITYWLGYVAEVKHHYVLQQIIDRFNDLVWKQAAKEAFAKVGMHVEEFTGKDLGDFAKNNPERYASFILALQQLKKSEYRTLPPLMV